jgi:hypothetical protein
MIAMFTIAAAIAYYIVVAMAVLFGVALILAGIASLSRLERPNYGNYFPKKSSPIASPLRRHTEPNSSPATVRTQLTQGSLGTSNLAFPVPMIPCNSLTLSGVANRRGTVFASVANPQGLAFDRAGNLFVTDIPSGAGSGTIFHYSRSDGHDNGKLHP